MSGFNVINELSRESTGLAMECLLTATWAELHQLKTIRSVATVLCRDVIALLADGAGERNTRTNIVLSHVNTSHKLNEPAPHRLCSEGEARTLDLTIMSRTL